MVINTLIAAWCAGLGVFMVCCAFGFDVEKSGRIAALAAAVPLFVSAYLQLRVVVAHAAGKIGRAAHWSQIAQPGELDMTPKYSRPTGVNTRLIPTRSVQGQVIASTVDLGGELARIVPVAVPSDSIEGVDKRDVYEFIQGLRTRSHARSAWVGRRMPSGKKVDPAYHMELVRVVEKAGGIEGRARGVAGRLVLSTEDLLGRLGLLSEPEQLA